MSTTKVFAVCYAETDGSTTDATWTETGIRLTVPEVHSMEKASGHAGTPNFFMKSWGQTTGYAIQDSGVNLLPQAVNQILTYTGDLVNNKWISIVDAALNNGNPCVMGSIAAATASTQHSGAVVGSSDGAAQI